MYHAALKGFQQQPRSRIQTPYCKYNDKTLLPYSAQLHCKWNYALYWRTCFPASWLHHGAIPSIGGDSAPHCLPQSRLAATWPGHTTDGCIAGSTMADIGSQSLLVGAAHEFPGLLNLLLDLVLINLTASCQDLQRASHTEPETKPCIQDSSCVFSVSAPSSMI